MSMWSAGGIALVVLAIVGGIAYLARRQGMTEARLEVEKRDVEAIREKGKIDAKVESQSTDELDALLRAQRDKLRDL